MCDGSLGEGEPIHMQGPPSRVSRTEFSADGKLLLLAGWKHLKVIMTIRTIVRTAIVLERYVCIDSRTLYIADERASVGHSMCCKSVASILEIGRLKEKP